MTPKQRAQATKVAEALQLNPTEVNLNKIVHEMNLKGSLAERFQPWIKTRWAEPSTRRGFVLLLTALTSRYLPPDLSPAILEIGLATVGLQAMVTKG